MVEEFKVTNLRPRNIPFSSISHIPPPRLIDKNPSLPFQELLGKLLRCLKTLADISFHVSFLCRYMSSYDETLYKMALDVLVYLRGTSHYGVVYDSSSYKDFEYGKGISIEFLVDSDWGGRVEDSKSTTAWFLRCCSSPIFAVSRCQSRPARSSTESEWNGVETVCGENEWYRGIFREFGITLPGATRVWQDNQSTMSSKLVRLQ